MKLISISDLTGFNPGVVYEVPEDLGRAHLQSGIAQKVVGVSGQPSVVPAVRPTDTIQGPDLPPWSKRITPEQYLQRHPNAKDAEVARLYVEKGLGKVKV